MCNILKIALDYKWTSEFIKIEFRLGWKKKLYGAQVDGRYLKHAIYKCKSLL